MRQRLSERPVCIKASKNPVEVNSDKLSNKGKAWNVRRKSRVCTAEAVSNKLWLDEGISWIW